MQKPLVKFAAYAIMILAILFALALILFAVLLFVLFPEGNMTKMTLTAIGLVILAAITGLVGYAVFEAMTKVAETEDKPESEHTNQKSPLPARHVAKLYVKGRPASTDVESGGHRGVGAKGKKILPPPPTRLDSKV